MTWLKRIFDWVSKAWRPTDEQLRFRERVKETEQVHIHIQQAKTETIEQIKQKNQLEAKRIRELERTREHAQLDIVRESMVELGQIIQAANAQADHFATMTLTAKCPECYELVKHSGRWLGREIQCTNPQCERTIQLTDYQ